MCLPGTYSSGFGTHHVCTVMNLGMDMSKILGDTVCYGDKSIFLHLEFDGTVGRTLKQ